jgi:hypothetical protein
MKTGGEKAVDAVNGLRLGVWTDLKELVIVWYRHGGFRWGFCVSSYWRMIRV